MKRRLIMIALAFFTFLLMGCDKGPTRDEIERLCFDIGQRAYYDPRVAAGPEASAARNGAIAECKLKYLTGK